MEIQREWTDCILKKRIEKTSFKATTINTQLNEGKGSIRIPSEATTIPNLNIIKPLIEEMKHPSIQSNSYTH